MTSATFVHLFFSVPLLGFFLEREKHARRSSETFLTLQQMKLRKFEKNDLVSDTRKTLYRVKTMSALNMVQMAPLLPLYEANVQFKKIRQIFRKVVRKSVDTGKILIKI